MEEALRARLLASTSVTDIIGSRVTWIERPQATGLPALTLQRVTPGRSYTFKGVIGLSGDGVQFECWGRSYGEAKLLSRAVIAAIEPEAVQGAVRFSRSFMTADRDMPSEELPGGTNVYRVSMDFVVWHSPAL